MGRASRQEASIWVVCLTSAACIIMASKGRSGKMDKGERAMQEQGYRYEIDMFWSGEDGCFISCVPDLDDCAAWGMTYEEALANVEIRAALASR